MKRCYYTFLLIFSLLLLTGAGPQRSYAQPQQISFNKQVGMVGMAVSLLRNRDMPPGHFTLRLSPENRMVTGCIDLADMGYSANYMGNALEIVITSLSAGTENLPLYPHLECNGNPQTPKADIPLSRDDLMERGIRHIRFRGGPFFDTFDLDISERMVALKPSLSGPSTGSVIKKQKNYRVKDSMSLWFYPEGTVIAFVPGLERSRRIREKVDGLMAQKGFVPLETVYPGFKSPLAMPHHYYYVEKDTKLSEMAAIDSGYPFGNITVDKTVYGLKGDKVTAADVSVFVRRPDVFE